MNTRVFLMYLFSAMLITTTPVVAAEKPAKKVSKTDAQKKEHNTPGALLFKFSSEPVAGRNAGPNTTHRTKRR